MQNITPHKNTLRDYVTTLQLNKETLGLGKHCDNATHVCGCV